MSPMQRLIKYTAMAFALILAIGIIAAIVGGVITLFGITNNSKQEELTSYSKVFDFNNIANISIDIQTEELNILIGNEIKVEAFQISNTFKAEINDDTLEIYTDSNPLDWINRLTNSKKGKINLYLPSDFKSDEINIDYGTGKLNIEQLNTNDLKIDAGTGSIKGTNLIAEKVDIDSGTGSIHFEEVNWKDTKIDSGTGSIFISGTLLGENIIDSGTGSITLELNGQKENYNFDVDKGFGSFSINGEKQPSELKLNNNAENSLQIDGGTGSIQLNFIN